MLHSKPWVFTKRLLYNIFWDLRFGGKILGGDIDTDLEHLGFYGAENADYADLKHIFLNKVKIFPDDVLVDVGCGKGRVHNWWLKMKLPNTLYGIEVVPWIAEKTARRLKKYKNVNILTGNAVEILPSDGTLFYHYNGFAQPIVGLFANRVHELSKQDGRCRRIIYFHPLHLDVFRTADWEITEIFKTPSKLGLSCAVIQTRNI